MKFINVYIPFDNVLEKNPKASLISFEYEGRFCCTWIEDRHIINNSINVNVAIAPEWSYRLYDVYEILQITKMKSEPIEVVKGEHLAKSLRQTFKKYNITFNKWDITNNGE